MKIPDRWLVWIGALAGLVGFFILNFAPLDGLLPINQGLFAALCSLLVN
ncbi:hypothetical protein [Methylobacterium durans]|nr:hypothetical protein [Methylobacterium durans]